MTLWLPQPLVVSAEGPDGSSRFTVEQPFLRIGSDAAADVVLAGAEVARRSVYVHGTERGIYAIPLQGAIGSDLPAGWLPAGQPIQVGAHRLHVGLADDPPISPPQSGLTTSGSARLGLPVVEILHAGRSLGKRRFSASLSLLGRRKQCALQLKGQNVSEFHCALYWDDARLWCIDLNSSNGTLLNGHPIVADEVRMGDELEVGNFQLIFRRVSSGGQQSQNSCSAAPFFNRRNLTAAGEVLPILDSSSRGGCGHDPGAGLFGKAAPAYDAELDSRVKRQPLEPAEWRAAFQSLVAEQEQLRSEISRLTNERRLLGSQLQPSLADTVDRLASGTGTVEGPLVVEAPAHEPARITPPAGLRLAGAGTHLSPPILPTEMPAVESDFGSESAASESLNSARRQKRDELASLVLDRLDAPHRLRRRWQWIAGTLVFVIATGLVLSCLALSGKLSSLLSAGFFEADPQVQIDAVTAGGLR